MSNRNSVPGTLPTIKTTLSSERPLSFSEFEKNKEVDFIMPKNFEDQKEHHPLTTSTTTKQQYHDNNKIKIISKSKNNTNNNINTNPPVNKSKLMKLKSKSSSSTNSSNNTPTPPNTAVVAGVFNAGTFKSLSQDEENNEYTPNNDDLDNRDAYSLAPKLSKPPPKQTKRIRKSAQKSTVAMSNSRDWEILEGLKLGQSFPYVPDKHEGYMMKNRKWPMKGWHKRYFSLRNGYLIYAKSQTDVERGKHHVQVDIGLSVIVCKERGFRIDMDADDTIYHLKTKTQKDFDEWKSHLRDHRLFRQNAISTGCDNHLNYDDDATPFVVANSTAATPTTTTPTKATSAIAALATAAKLSSVDIVIQANAYNVQRYISNRPPEDSIDGDSETDGVYMKLFSDDATTPTAATEPPQSLATTTAVDDVASLMEKKMVLLTSDELNEVQLKLCDLGMLLADIQQQCQHNNNYSNNSNYNNNLTDGASVASVNVPMTKKEKPKRQMRMKKDKRQQELLVPDLSPLIKCSSNPSLALNEELANPPITTFHPSSPAFHQPTNQSEGECNGGGGGGGMVYMQSQFYKQAEFVLSKLDKINNQLMASERARNNASYNANYVQSLKLMIAELKKQNSDLKGKLTRINTESLVTPETMTTIPSMHPSLAPTPTILQPHQKTPSVDSSDSLDSGNNQFYDAPDQLEPSSDGSEEDEEEDETSDAETKVNEELEPNMEERFSRFQMRRRSRLPSPSVSSDVSIWGLLRKNIGKDLSKISMPVVMNEPLNALQRLCEELEYSELLERAVDVDDPLERMVWVAVFTVSTYANTFTRAARKPFNPLLGETYEIDRSEKGWRFVAEQVSHHPPVSASYCESKDFTMWQDMQVKTKFWGKSMEVQPIGTAHLLLNKHNEEYTWNKATSCIHNILGGQRWVEHYGEVVVTNHTRGIVCKLNYAKSSYFSAKKYEVYGQVYAQDDGPALHHLFGRWNESIFHGQSESTAKCIWRPGALPPDHQLYYGFTKFAMELNEIDKEQENNYPCTDTRFRPDQRLLEQGRVEDAEMEKRMVEQNQRDMRKDGGFDEALYQPTWFIRRTDEDDTDTYTYNGTYWNKRKNPGFRDLHLPLLW